MNLQHIDEISTIAPGNYVVVRVNGLYGDLLHASCKFEYIMKQFPDADWIFIHSYGQQERVQTCLGLLKYLEDIGKLKYYFIHPYSKSSPLPPNIRNMINMAGIGNERIFDCYVFQGKPPLITRPHIGIEIPEIKDPDKAVIFRFSGWHGHFPARNRPMDEWKQIERKLLDVGYKVYLLGHDDLMENINNIVDLRNKFTIHELLDFSKDASICITTTTFFYVWMQFVCPTMVLSDSGDFQNLNRYWKLDKQMQIANVHSSYLNQVFNFIESTRAIGRK